jgi:glutamyl-tRNA synthetase
MTDSVRVRFAPSPTGHLHIGGARTAIYNWAFARRSGGTFILRIDDTDPERSTVENTEAILRSLRWLGIDWDEGPEVGGSVGPYFQTARAELYVHALETLKSAGSAYPCFCTADELEAKRGDARATGGTAGYDRTCRALDPVTAAERVAAGEPHVWRLAVPADRTGVSFVDAIRGDMTFPGSALDDFVLVRTDGTPTYNFATVADDAAMAITHVIRGDDHLSNTPRQILVFEGLGAEVPEFAHLSMIWGPDGKRLSKRHGATSAESYRDEGYLPEALLNYLALLGWSLDGETTIISRDVLLESFSLDRVSRNPAIFDVEKLDWMNGVYIRELSTRALAERVMPFLIDAGLLDVESGESSLQWLAEALPLVSQRVKRLDEVPRAIAFLFGDQVALDPAACEKTLAKDGARDVLEAALSALTSAEPFDAPSIEGVLRAVPEAMQRKPKDVFQVVRVAVTGSTVSPPLFESIALLGRVRTVVRLQAALSQALCDEGR